MGQPGVGDSSEGEELNIQTDESSKTESTSKKDESSKTDQSFKAYSNHGITRFIVALIPWLIIVIGGTFSLARLGAIQTQLHDQQATISAHQSDLSKQLKVNDELRADGSAVLGKSLLRQCLEEHKIDDKLATLGKDLLSSKVLDVDSKAALADFMLEVKKDQLALDCKDPYLTIPTGIHHEK